MKAQLGIRLNNILNGYLNLDCAVQPGENDGRIGCDPYKLDDIIDHNELEEFVVHDTLDFLPLQARQSAITHWTTKIAHGGKLIITGNDITEIGRLVHSGKLDLAQANSIIYGIGRKSALRPQETIQMVVNTGQFVLDNVSYSNPFTYVITLIRK